jgi:plasmid stabilization system protein ParE
VSAAPAIWSFILHSSFVVAYSIEKERIVILAIYHGAQQWPEVLSPEDGQGSDED